MDRDETRDKLLYLSEMEWSGRGDAFRIVAFYTNEYRRDFGNDDFIEDFVSTYLGARAENR